MSAVSVKHTSHTVVYVIFGVAFLLLAGVALLTFRSADQSEEATAKAGQLQTALTRAGFRAPQTEQIVAVLGTDGAAVCLDPGNALRRGILNSQITNGAAGPGTRPVIADSRVVQGQKIIMEIYCPDTLAAFQQVVDDLRFAAVAS